MSNDSVILSKLIEAKPDFEDENGKGIFLGKTRLYVKNGKVIAICFLIVITILIYSRDPINKIYQAFENIVIVK